MGQRGIGSRWRPWTLLALVELIEIVIIDMLQDLRSTLNGCDMARKLLLTCGIVAALLYAAAHDALAVLLYQCPIS